VHIFLTIYNHELRQVSPLSVVLVRKRSGRTTSDGCVCRPWSYSTTVPAADLVGDTTDEPDRIAIDIEDAD